jgi:hypothetical protein
MTWEAKPLNRREFLYYFWGASTGLIAIGTCGAAAWYALPHRKFGKEGGLFRLYRASFPLPQSEPFLLVDAQAWLWNTESGLIAYSGFCPYPGRGPHLIKCVATQFRFVCPICGSKFEFDGTFILGQGPARRNLDQYVIEVTTPSGNRFTPPDGGPVYIQDASDIIMDVRRIVEGKRRV